MRWIVSRGARNLILLSRSGASTNAAMEMVKQLEQQGVRVHAPLCDISDRPSLEAALRECSEKMPPIKGCIQTSAVLKVSITIHILSFGTNNSDTVTIGCNVQQYVLGRLEHSYRAQGPRFLEPPRLTTSRTIFLHHDLLNLGHPRASNSNQLRRRKRVPGCPCETSNRIRRKGRIPRPWPPRNRRAMVPKTRPPRSTHKRWLPDPSIRDPNPCPFQPLL